MNISYNWLTDYVPVNCSLELLCEKMTMAGIEVEDVEKLGCIPEGIVAAKILERVKHPNADKLSVCKVFDGSKELQIVCGAPNCDAGHTVPLATVGTVMMHKDGEFTIKEAKLRGELSQGMMCSAAELGLSEDHDGLLILPENVTPGTPLQQICKGDVRIEVEVTPNRPDWLSHWGIARDVAALLDTDAKLPEIKVPAAKSYFDGKNLINVEAPELCQRYSARIIKGVKIGESPDWLKEKLNAIGLRPINNVVDITNFVLMELGQPLHAFDFDTLAKSRIVVRRAHKDEKITILDGREVTLDEQNLVIADGSRPRAIAGVMGGLDSGVTEDTVNILLESAIFEKSNIRATSRNLGISTDASYRYERGVDYEMAKVASDRATALILELAGGEVASDFVEVAQGAPALPVIDCRFARINALVGVELTAEQIVDIFRKLHLKVDKVTGKSCVITAPAFRLDLEREADLAEEVARVNGLDKIPVKAVAGKIADTFAHDAYYPTEKLRHELIGLGLFECMHYSMVNMESALADSRFKEGDLVRISNPLSLDLACMRPSLFGEMLATLERNISRRNLDLALFELGRVFCGNDKLYPEERQELCIILSGRKHPERFGAEAEELYDFYDLKGLLESIFEKRKMVDCSFKVADDPRFVPGEAVEILIDGKKAGHCGKLNKKYTKGLRTSYPVYSVTLEVGALLDAKVESIIYEELSPFPATSRDVSFIAPAALNSADVIDFIVKARLPNLEKVELFDIFTDEENFKGRKSMSYKVTFRSRERTLTDEEVNKAFDKLRSKLNKELGVELR